MKHIRNLWNLLKQEISLWKYEKQELVKGICYIVMIAAKQMEKKIMSVMPYFILLYVRIANPGYFDILYESFAGVLVAVISLLCLWIADIWAERVTEIEI